jgi:hypothetical protein
MTWVIVNNDAINMGVVVLQADPDSFGCIPWSDIARCFEKAPY